ncbi:MAG: hypothetical protein V1907_01325 [Candidatus Kerfeldbacteria bacterium]
MLGPGAANDRSFAFGLTPDEVDRFRDIMRRECGVELTPEQAWARAIELLSLFRMLLGPLPEDRPAPQFEHRRS